MLILTACRAPDGAMQQALRLRTELLQAGGCRYAADVSVHYDDVRFDFSLDCVCRSDGAAQMTVRAPQTLAGIAAELEADSARVEFEDTAVAFGLMADGNLVLSGADAGKHDHYRFYAGRSGSFGMRRL